MLVKVAALARLFQFVEKGDCPGRKLGPPKMLARCGMLPARNLESKVEVPAEAGALLKAFSEAEVDPGRKGLVVGVGREVLEVKEVMFGALLVVVGEIREGRVPARPLRAGLLMPVSVKGTKGTRSGKPSWFGDSGISNNGVEVPLVGGPQMFPLVPVGVCSSLVLLGNSLCADSCSGEPVAPLESCPSAGPLALVPLNGDLADGLLGSAIGERPDKFKLSEPSARDDGPITASGGFVELGDPVPVHAIPPMLQATTRSALF